MLGSVSGLHCKLEKADLFFVHGLIQKYLAKDLVNRYNVSLLQDTVPDLTCKRPQYVYLHLHVSSN